MNTEPVLHESPGVPVGVPPTGPRKHCSGAGVPLGTSAISETSSWMPKGGGRGRVCPGFGRRSHVPQPPRQAAPSSTHPPFKHFLTWQEPLLKPPPPGLILCSISSLGGVHSSPANPCSASCLHPSHPDAISKDSLPVGSPPAPGACNPSSITGPDPPGASPRPCMGSSTCWGATSRAGLTSGVTHSGVSSPASHSTIEPPPLLNAENSFRLQE